MQYQYIDTCLNKAEKRAPDLFLQCRTLQLATKKWIKRNTDPGKHSRNCILQNFFEGGRESVEKLKKNCEYQCISNTELYIFARVDI